MATPSVVAGIKVVNMLNNRDFKVIWNSNASAELVMTYNIYRSETSYTGFSFIKAILSPEIQHIDQTIRFSFDHPWYYKVTAVNSEGESSIDNTQAITDFDYFAFFKPPNQIDYKSNIIQLIVNEIPTGLVNGLNTLFYTKYNFKPSTLMVFMNNGKLVAGTFSVVTPNSFLVTNTPTVTGTIPDILSVEYVKI